MMVMATEKRPVCPICGAPKMEMRGMLGKPYDLCIDCWAQEKKEQDIREEETSASD